MHTRIASGFVVLAIAALPALAQQRVDERRPATADGVVTVSNVAGAVKVVGTGSSEVHVTGTLAGCVERLDFTVTGRNARIKVVYPKDTHRCDGADLTIEVPAGSRVEVDTVSARIGVEGVSGAVELQSVSGDVAVAGSPAEVRAESVSGPIDLNAASAPVEAKSVSGTVTVRGASHRVRASAVSGRISVEAAALERGDFNTVSGEVRVRADLAGGGRLEVQTVSGPVDLELPSAVSADFEAETFSGDVRNELGPPAQRTSEFTPGHELRFTAGTGSAQVRIKTFSGPIRIGKS